MDVEMADTAEISEASSSLSTRRLRKALTIITMGEEQIENTIPTTVELAQALCRPNVTPLRTYQAASCLREGQLREIVQFLILSGPKAALVILRLLTIMHRLPGNWELTMEFLEQLTPESWKMFPTRVFSLIANLGGRKAYTLCDWSLVIERAFKDDETEARWALTALSENIWNGPTEQVLRVFEWDTELPYELEPSVWREIKWASFAQHLCISDDTGQTSATVVVSDAEEEEERISGSFESFLSHFGDAAQHYVPVGTSLMRRRSTSNGTEARDNETSKSHPDSNMPRGQPIVLTPTIREAVREMAEYLAYGVPFILEGPTGCGKTTLLSYLAQLTSYDQSKTRRDTQAPGVTFIQMDSAMLQADGESFSSQIGGVVPIPEGGGFRWRPGPIGAAAERGDWVVFENIGGSTRRMSSAVAIIRKLANAKPGDRLEAPGRGEPIIIRRGFRCVGTRTLSLGGTDDSWEPPGGWESWYRVRMKEISFDEKVEILSERFVQIPDCISRVVTVVEHVAKYTDRLRGPLFRTPTLREAVRICQRLDSLKRAVGSLSVENAFLETMDVLVAWCSSQEHFEELSNIVSLGWSLSPAVGADMYSRHRPTLTKLGETVKVGRATALSLTKSRHIELSGLSLTGHTLRLLERTLRCLEVGENVLLSGETGSGKTAVIQELASLMGKKLIVVNLSRQSELDDLVGGFRPIDADVAVPLLAKRFESAFCQCMSSQKNATFLDALQKASRSVKHHRRALRLMEGALSAIPKSSKQRSKTIRQEWEAISSDLQKLAISQSPNYLSNAQLLSKTSTTCNKELVEPARKRPRVSTVPTSRSSAMEEQPAPATKRTRRIDFEFAEGVLIQAMREGDWILLDELNLAPPELLEQLVSILEIGRVTVADEHGSVVSKKGGFALFGAMNPPTDTGKRPLPSILRTRFTEFHVGDMLLREDLLDLVAHKFIRNSSGSESNRMSLAENEIARDTADFYLKTYQMAKEGLIEDSIGKPIRFSLRSLSRMLDFATGLMAFLKKGHQEKRRALVEGALTAFGTQLPRKSRIQMHSVVETHLLGGPHGKPSKRQKLFEFLSVPRNSPVSVRMLHGFPVESNRTTTEKELNAPSNFVVTPAVEKTLTDVCRALVVGAPKLPILLQGPTAAGKTSLVSYLATRTGNKLIRINNHEHTEMSEYIGRYIATEDGSLVFSEGPLVRAARNGDWVMLDELNLAPPDVLESLNRLLDDNREVFIPETAEIVKAATGFRLFATQNPPGLYGGRKELSRAFRSRFIEVQVNELPDSDLCTILEKRSDIPASFAHRMVAVMRDLQVQRRASELFSGREGYITARDLFRWAARGPRSRDELAVHGFLLLAERARSLKERLLIRDVLCKQVDVAKELLTDEKLYAFHFANDDDGDASSQCLDVSLQKLGLDRHHISYALGERNIVLTPSMRRMLTLLIHSTANREPALLVGATGGGKTSACAAIASALSRQFLAINCHRHTEASDILGGFRPVRDKSSTSALFEWIDGPLIESMKEGSWMLVDEINMADDAVVERLNSVLELERTILLSEKGASKSSASPDIIVATENFRILATMNPGGDFGKKELSPALRNRFTELWIPPPVCIDDYLPIINQRLSNPPYPSDQWKLTSVLLQEMIKASLHDTHSERDGLNNGGQSLRISIRDLTAWCDFIIEAPKVCDIDPLLAAVHGCRLVFLDGLSVGLASSQYALLESEMWNRILHLLPPRTRKHAEMTRYAEETKMAVESVAHDVRDTSLKVDCFSIPTNKNGSHSLRNKSTSAFSFDAPSTIRNTARLARAMCVGYRPVLLEGPPGCGKSSLIAALASISGFKYSRINLSDGTEMSDLVGCDAPGKVQGSFVFRQGPLLEALTTGGWILLDELNLASQSVLEGLNSVLDHRKTLFVPELNEEFKAHPSFRLFGAQNSALDGGGRRGLPKSFLNRFTRVQVEAPKSEDFKSIISSTHPQLASTLVLQLIECLQYLRGSLEASISPKERFGLRDALRWCDLISGIDSGRRLHGTELLSLTELYTCFDVAILRGLKACERESAKASFERTFGRLNTASMMMPSIRVRQEGGFRIGFGQVKSLGRDCSEKGSESAHIPLLATRSWELQALSFAMNACWPVTLFSPSPPTARFETRRIVEQIATLFGRKICLFDGASLTDTEDFVGGYVQHDGIASMRQIVTLGESLMLEMMCVSVTEKRKPEDGGIPSNTYTLLTKLRNILQAVSRNHNSLQNSIPSFLRLTDLIITELSKPSAARERSSSSLKELEQLRNNLDELQKSLATGGYAPFKWRKSALMLAIEKGEWVFLQDADVCPPALLDRLNPIFERAAVSLKDIGYKEHNMTLSPMILAEAPSNEDGSPVYLKPHSHFRMFFSISKPIQDLTQCGLSKALLDRCLKLCVEGGLSDHDSCALASSAGLPFNYWLPCDRQKSLGDKSSALVSAITDRQKLAERVRLFSAMGRIPKSPKSLERNVLSGPAPSKYLCCTGKFMHSFDDLPFTNVGEFVDNPVLSSMERDIASMRLLETASQESFQVFAEEVRQLLISTTGGTQVHILDDGNGNILGTATAKTDLFLSSANAFLLGSTSHEDLAARSSILQQRSSRFKGSLVSEVYSDRMDVAIQFCSSSESYIKHYESNVLPYSSGAPLDPLFSFDRSSQHLTTRVTEIGRQDCKYNAKRLRADLFALGALRKTLAAAHRSSHNDSFFARAELAFKLRQADKCRNSGRSPLNVLAFDIVRSTEASIDSFYCFVRKSNEWELHKEEQWMNFFNLASRLCRLMKGDKDPLPSALAAIIYSVATALNDIEARSNACFHGILEGLHRRLRTFCAEIESTLLASNRTAIPTSRLDQGLEADFINAVVSVGRKALSESQLDAVVSGVATLTMQDVHKNEGLRQELGKVLKLINGRAVYSDDDVSLHHWSRVMHQTSVQTMHQVISLMVTHDNRKISPSPTQSVVLRIMDACRSYMVCVPCVNLSSMVSVQKLRWIFESSTAGNPLSTSMKSSFSDVNSLVSICLLDELNSLLTAEHQLQSDHTNGHMRGVTSMSSTLFLATSSSAAPFWSLSKACAEAVCAAVLIAGGSHKIDHIGSLSKGFLKRCAATEELDRSSLHLPNNNSIPFERDFGPNISKLQGNLHDHLRGFVERAVSDKKQTSESERFLQLGKGWVAAGLASLNSYCAFIERCNGIDPSQFSSSMTSFAIDNICRISLSSSVYKVYAAHRLGGDLFSGSVPDERFTRMTNTYLDVLKKASQSITSRPSDKNAFDLYESFVHKIHATVVRRIVETSLLSKLHPAHSHTVRAQVIEEIIHLAKSCATMSFELKSEGPFGHFRDISTILALGLHEVQYGLHLCRKALEKCSVVFSQELEQQRSFLSDMMSFPRAAHTRIASSVDSIKLSKRFSVDGECLIAMSNYLLGCEFHGARNRFGGTSQVLSEVVLEWKKRTLTEEKETEERESLHVLREVGRKQMIPGSEITEELSQDEHSDYITTFNPIPQEEEEELCGLTLPQDCQQDWTKGNHGKGEESSGQKVNPESFWALHRKAFPPGAEIHNSVPGVEERAQQLSLLSSYLFSLTSGIRSNVDDMSSVWETFAAELVSQKYAVMVSPTENTYHDGLHTDSRKSPYNFYSDPNVEELAKASAVLKDLKNAISLVQERSFKETGNHPVLDEIDIAISRVAKVCKTEAPLSRMILGLENVLRKADEWHRLFATSQARLDAEIMEASKLVARWRRLEVQSWPLLLQSRVVASENRGCRWVFLLYDAVIHEGVRSVNSDPECIKGVIGAVDQFLRTSPCGEFAIRLDMVSSLGRHILSFGTSNTEHIEKLGRCLIGLGAYYRLFENRIRREIDDGKRVVDKQLTEFTKLTSWNAAHDLGSSCKMFKDKDKHLQYLRLKTAAEKTRRKLHKLCLKVDEILRRPVHESLTRQLSAIGFFSFIGDMRSSGTEFSVEPSVSERLGNANETLMKEIAALTEHRLNSPVCENPAKIGSLLSQVQSLERKLGKLKREVCTLGKVKCELATDFSVQLRSIVRGRIKELQKVKTADIQFKKRALADLFKTLQRVGISPFERSSPLESHKWLSAPNPTICTDYNTIADELFWQTAVQTQRLREVSDSRSRNADISNDDAVKFRAFCQCMFERACGQRRSLNGVFESFRVVSSEIAALLRLKFNDSALFKRPTQMLPAGELKQVFCQLKDISLDLQASEQIFKRMLQRARNTRRMQQDATDQSIHQVKRTLDCSIEGLDVLETVFRSAITAIEETLDVEALKSFQGIREPIFGIADGEYVEAYVGTKVALSKLCKILNDLCSKAKEISPDNFVFLLLRPVHSFVKDAFNAYDLTTPATAETQDGEFGSVWSQMSQDANKIIQTILIGSQRILSWNDLSITSDGLQNTNEHAMCEDYMISGLVESGLLKTANARILSLSSAVSISKITMILHRNALSIRRSLQMSLSHENIVKIVHLQRILAKFVGEYLDAMVMPCLLKCSQFHVQSLCLLQSLSSVFIGLCRDGFCRPAEQDESIPEQNEEGKTGGGFGDAGDGDMSFAQNVSDQIEDEEQLLGLRDDIQNGSDNPEPQRSEEQDENGVDMTTDFDGDLQDVKDEEEDEQEVDEAEKEMAPEAGTGDNEIDQRLWGDSDKPQADVQNKEKDMNEKDAPGTTQSSSELVAKNDTQEDKQGPDPHQKTKKTSEENNTDAEDDMETEQKGDTSEDDEISPGKPESISRQKNPFTGDNNDSDTDREADSENKSNPNRSEELPSHRDDHSTAQAQELTGNDVNDDDLDSNATSHEDGVKEDRADQTMSDLEDGDVEEKDGMIGVEQDGSCEDAGNENAEGSPTEPSDIPENLNLQDAIDSNGSSEEDNEDATQETVFDDFRQTEVEAMDANEDEEAGEGTRMTSEDDVLEENDQSQAEKHANENTVRKQQQLTQEGNGKNTAGENSQRQGMEDPAENDQEYSVDGIEDRNNNKARTGETDMKGTFGGSDLPGVMPAVKDNENGELREGGESDKTEPRNSNTRLDPNPLRTSEPEELVEIWKQHLKVLENERDTNSANQGTEEPCSTDGLWEFKNTTEDRENDMHALGAATEDQHRPLLDQEEEKNPPEGQSPQEAKLDISKTEEVGSSSDAKAGMDISEDWKENKRTIDSDAPGNEDEDYQTNIKSHPAYKAAEERQESNSPVIKRQIPRSSSDRHVSTVTEVVTGQREDEEEQILRLQAKLPWKMEDLDPKSAVKLWHMLDSKVSAGSSVLCEQLRLVLEPTEATGLSGGYRTGKRLNMRKVIEYVASDFQKDRIWLRRVKPDKRSYDVLVAIDDSASMAESEAGTMAVESLALVLSALSRLEIGRVGVVRFGVDTDVVRDFDEPLPMASEQGGELLQKFSFSQGHTDFVKLLNFIYGKMGHHVDSGAVEHVSLAFVISDGRLSNRDEVRRQLRLLRNSNVLVAFIILDQVIGDQPSIFDVKRVDYDKHGNLLIMPYMEDFPVDFYTTVRDIRSLPSVLADALRQWVEATNA